MNTCVEKGLTSHSFIMIAPQEITGDNEEGWIVVSSRRTLRRLRKISKNQPTKSLSSNSNTSYEAVVQASSENGSAKSSKSSTS